MTIQQKMNVGIISLCVLLALGSLATSAYAGDKASRPCKKEDLIGTWEMISVKPVYDKTDPVFFPFQKFVFKQDSSMKFISSEKPLTKEWLEKFQKQPVEIDYTLSDKGIVTMTWHSRPHNDSALCAYTLSDVPPELLAKIPPADRGHLPRKDDATLSYLNNAGKIAYQKILRKTER
jgi:hypothetical protein